MKPDEHGPRAASASEVACGASPRLDCAAHARTARRDRCAADGDGHSRLVAAIGLRILVALVVASPAVLWWLSPFVYRLPVLAWLADRRPISLTLDETGITFRHGELMRAARWDDVVELGVFESRDITAEARLRLRDGTRIHLPGELALPRRADGAVTALLDEIERYRPEISRAGERRRQARAISFAFMGIVVALGVIGTFLLYGR